MSEALHASPYHGDERMQQPAVPEPVCPRSLRRHKPGITRLVLGSNLLLGQRRAVVLRHRVPLEPGSMRGRVELGRLLQHDGLVGRDEADVDVLREGDSDASPERPLQRQQEARDDGSRHHCDGSAGDAEERKICCSNILIKKRLREKNNSNKNSRQKLFFLGQPCYEAALSLSLSSSHQKKIAGCQAQKMETFANPTPEQVKKKEKGSSLL